MGRKVKRVVAVVAAIAVPYLAPQIASTIGLSSAIGAAAANTVTGAVLGAGVAKATGGNVATGAILGGVGSYLNTPSAPVAASAPVISPPSVSTVSAGGSPYSLTAGGVPSLTAPVSSLAAPTTALPSAAPFAIDYGLTSGFSPAGALGEGALGSGFSVAGAQPTFSSLGFSAAGSTGLDFGAQLSAPAAAAGSPYTLTSTAMPAAAGVPSAAAPTAGLAVPTSLTAGGAAPTLSAMTTAAAAPAATTAVTGAAPAATGAAAATAPLTAGQKAWEFTKSIGGDLLKTAAVVYALGAGNVPGEIPEEQMMMYQQELERLAQENPAAYQAKLQEAQKFLQMASTFDPQYFGEEEARKAQIRGARAKRESLRGLTGRQRAAAERQFDLETGRSAGTSYTQGAQRALTGQIQTTEAGLKLMPRPSDYTSLSSLQNLGNVYQNQATARRQYASDIGALADLGAGIYEKGRDIYG